MWLYTKAQYISEYHASRGDLEEVKFSWWLPQTSKDLKVRLLTHGLQEWVSLLFNLGI